MLLLAVFSGPRPRVDELISLFASAGMPAAVDRTAGQPNTRFHALVPPAPIIDSSTDEPMVDDDGNELLMPPVHQTDRDGEPVWDNDPAELELEVLFDEERLDTAIELAGRYDYRLRVHAPSGFSTVRQAEAVAAARDLPSRHPLLAAFDSDKQLLADFRKLLAEAQR